MISVSVIICTYNPDETIFNICLDAILVASKISSIDEIVIVDNNSIIKVDSYRKISELKILDLNISVIQETIQGLTASRVTGIRHSKGDLVIFVDDDNIIEPDFIHEAKKIYNSYPYIGSYSGQISLVYNTVIPQWTRKYWNMLAYREFKGNYWSNVYFDHHCMPCGAGLCIRKEVGFKYVELVKGDQRRLNLDRSKNSLLSGGDNDLAMCAIDISMGIGIFEELRLKHFIPSFRFTLDYLKKLAQNIYFSSVILKDIRMQPIYPVPFKTKVKRLFTSFFLSFPDGIIQRACLMGEIQGYKFVKQNNSK